jgi:putative redox protein
MTTPRHVARAVATAATAPPRRVELRAHTHHLVAAEPTTNGGGDAGPFPFGLLLNGAPACTAITWPMYATRKGWALAAIEADVRYDLTDNGHASIVRAITVPAEVPAEQRGRLADVAEPTPVIPAVWASTPVTTTMRTTPVASTPHPVS